MRVCDSGPRAQKLSDKGPLIHTGGRDALSVPEHFSQLPVYLVTSWLDSTFSNIIIVAITVLRKSLYSRWKDIDLSPSYRVPSPSPSDCTK